MSLLLKIVILLVILVLTGYPYFRKLREGDETTARQSRRRQALLHQKESVYAAIKELDFDYHMGKLSPEDYNDLRAKYEKRAVSLLKQLDEPDAPSMETVRA